MSRAPKTKHTHCKACNVELNLNTTNKSSLKFNFSKCRSCIKKWWREYTAKLRKQAIHRLGNKCECCGIDNYDFLSIDHINGGGIYDRDRFKTWDKYLKHLTELDINELKNKYRALCYNCNNCSGFHKICAHKLTNKFDITTLPISNKTIKNTHLSKEEHKNRELKLRRISYLKSRLEMIKAYGGKCSYCNEDNPLFLSLDHINNNGTYDETGKDFYNQMRRLGFPGKNTQLQLLCYNCNSQKEYIKNRFDKSEQIKMAPETYIQEPYNLSKEEDKILTDKAREIYCRIEASLLHLNGS